MNRSAAEYVAESMTVCKRVLYSGTVQGVGFRFTTRTIAEGFRVAGFVRNLADGRVELLAQGADDEITRFLDAVSRRMSENIVGQQVTDVPGEEFEGFEIRR